VILTFDLLTSFLALLAAVVVYICTERLIGVDNLSRFHFSVPTLTHTHTHTHTHTITDTTDHPTHGSVKLKFHRRSSLLV